MLTSGYWRVMFAVPIAICTLQSSVILLFFNYETPMFSIIQNDDPKEAAKVLKRIYLAKDVPKVIDFIKNTNLASLINKKRMSYSQALFGFGIWEQTWIAMFIQTFRVLAGNNQVNLYSSIIFKQIGINVKLGNLCSSLFNLLGTTLNFLLSSYLGRKQIFMLGQSLIVFSFAMMTIGTYIDQSYMFMSF